MKTNEPAAPAIFVIFGGTGDLAWRKLVPALFDLFQDQCISLHFSIIIIGRKPLKDSDLLERFFDGVKKFSRQKEKVEQGWKYFAKHISYHYGDLNSIETYNKLAERCTVIENEWGIKSQHIFYMATPPLTFGEIPKLLAEAGGY